MSGFKNIQTFIRDTIRPFVKNLLDIIRSESAFRDAELSTLKTTHDADMLVVNQAIGSLNTTVVANKLAADTLVVGQGLLLADFFYIFSPALFPSRAAVVQVGKKILTDERPTIHVFQT